MHMKNQFTPAIFAKISNDINFHIYGHLLLEISKSKIPNLAMDILVVPMIKPMDQSFCDIPGTFQGLYGIFFFLRT